MPDSDCGDFYYHLVAQGYDHFLAGIDFGDTEFYRRLIREDGRPALELGCGTGRLLLPLIGAGLQVHGLDPSPEMLAICRRKAEKQGVSPVLHEQAMQDLQLEYRYGVIFCAVGSFALLSDAGDVDRTLRACLRHLSAGGQLVLALQDSSRSSASDEGEEGGWCLRRRFTDSDGRIWRALERITSRADDPVIVSEWRYEVSDGSEILAEQRHGSKLRRWTAGELGARMREAGFDHVRLLKPYTNRSAEPMARDFVAVSRAE